MLVRALTCIAAVALLGACDKPAPTFNNVDITGANYANEFSLTDTEGQRRQLADFRGKVVVLFFGFTQCPDVCPTTMADYAQVKRALGADGERLQFVFVTLDPERDTPSVLKPYVTQFDPSFVALVGTADEIARTAKTFKVFFQKVPGKTADSYSIDHTAGTYVFDRDGRIRLFIKHSQAVDAITADLKKLL